MLLAGLRAFADQLIKPGVNDGAHTFGVFALFEPIQNRTNERAMDEQSGNGAKKQN